MKGQLNKSAKSLIRASIAAEMPNEIGGEGNKLRINYREHDSYNTSSKVANATLDSSSGERKRDALPRHSRFFPILLRAVSCLIESSMPYYGRGCPGGPARLPLDFWFLSAREIAEIMGPEQQQQQRLRS